MPNNIDNRIVNMQFNNGQFEKGVHQSLSTLDKLKAALKFDKAADGLSRVERLGNGLDLKPLAFTLENAAKGFSVLEVAAVAAITNITNKAVNFGLNLAKSLSIDQVTMGWSKFAGKAQSVATIMAATNKSVEEVGAQMDILNSYTDETSASFTDMTSNIGKFTNAGVPLEDAVQAMQGITNWGYRSGATMNEMSRAMYNLSQAMAVGSVKLMDWKSIENANMATQEFKQTAIDTAVAMGQLTKNSDGTFKTLKGHEVTVTDFNQALSDAWFTSEVLTETLNKYGNFSNNMQNYAKDLNVSAFELMQFYNKWEKSGRISEDLIKSTGKSASELSAMFAGMGTGVDNYTDKLIDSLEIQKKSNLTDRETIALKKKTTNSISKLYDIWLKSGKKTSENLRAEYSKLGLEELSSLENITKEFEQFNANKTLGVGAYRAAQEYRSLRDAIDATKDAVSTGWMTTFEKIFGNAEEAKRIWGSVGNTLYEVFASGAYARNELLDEWHLGGGYDSFVRAIEALSAIIISIKEQIDDTFGFLFEGVDAEALINATEKLNLFLQGLRDTSEYGEITQDLFKDGVVPPEVLDEMNSHIEKTNTFWGTLGDILDGVASVAKVVKDVFSGIIQVLRPVFSGLKTIADDIVNLFSALGRRLSDTEGQLSEDDTILGFFANLANKLGPYVEKVTGFIHDFLTALTDFIDPNTESGLNDFAASVSESFEKIFGVIGSVFQAVFPILSKVGEVFGAAFGFIAETIKGFLANADIRDFFHLIGGGLKIGIGAGILKIVNGIKDAISGVVGKKKEGAKSGGFFSTISESIKTFSENIAESVEKLAKTTSLKQVATSLLIFAGALMIIALIPADKLGESVATIALALAAFTGAMALLGKMDAKSAGTMILASAAMAVLASGILVLSLALGVLALIPADKLSSSLQFLAGGLAAMVITLLALSAVNPAKLLLAATSMLILAPAILALSVSLGLLALIPGDKIGTSLQVLSGGLTVVTVALMALTAVNPGKLLLAAASMLILTPAILGLTIALMALSLVPADKIEGSLGALAVVLIEVVASLAILSALGPMILVASAALLIAAPAIVLLAGALLLLSLVPADSVQTSIMALGAALTVIAVGAAAITPFIPGLLGLAAALLGISVASIALGAGLTVISVGLTALGEAVAGLVDSVAFALQTIVDTIISIGDTLVGVGGDILDWLAEGIRGAVGTMATVAGEIVNGLIDGIRGLIANIGEIGRAIGSALLGGVKGVLGIASPSKEFKSVGQYSVMGLLGSINSMLGQVATAGKSVGETLMTSTMDALNGYDHIMDDHILNPVMDLSTRGSLSGYSLNGVSSLGAYPNVSPIQNGSTTKNIAPVFNIYQQPGQDEVELARIINRELGRVYQR